MTHSNNLSHPTVLLLLGVLASGCASGPAPRGQARDVSSPESVKREGDVLVLLETPSGRITHGWRPLEESDRPLLGFQPREERTSGRILLAAVSQRDCHQEFGDCIDTCMDRPLTEDYAHISSAGAKGEYCRKGCWQPYRDCEEAGRLHPQRFSAMAPALDWLKRHHTEVLAGSLVVIAGVTFVVAFPPGALLALIPVTVLASSEGAREPSLTGVAP